MKNKFRCPAIAGRSLKIAAEPAVIEQTPAVILAKMRFLARREVGRAPFWICDGPFSASMHDDENNTSTKTAYTQWAPCRSIEEMRHFFQAPCAIKLMFLSWKITFNCKEWSLKLCAIKFGYVIFEKFSGTRLSRGSYGVYVLLFFAKIALLGSLRDNCKWRCGRDIAHSTRTSMT